MGGLSETWFEMQIAESTDTIKVSTTRIDAVFGVTFVRIAPTHPLANVIQSISSYAINPFSKEKVPLFVDTALTGDTAIMGIPAHDERDFEFAKKYDIPIKYVIGKSF
ncbi:MAG: hypothetical protein LBO09_03040 [Candidatus Peribacteria bacterium]|nr:hypothetical protein [Candidatus Peribacteria bacterium]